MLTIANALAAFAPPSSWAHVASRPLALSKRTSDVQSELHMLPMQFFADPAFSIFGSAGWSYHPEGWSYQNPALPSNAMLTMIMGASVFLGYKDVSHDEQQLTPLTVGSNLPALDELRTSCFFLSSSDSVCQHICHSANAAKITGNEQDDFGESCELSDELSTHYGEPILLCKTPSVVI